MSISVPKVLFTTVSSSSTYFTLYTVPSDTTTLITHILVYRADTSDECEFTFAIKRGENNEIVILKADVPDNGTFSLTVPIVVEDGDQIQVKVSPSETIRVYAWGVEEIYDEDDIFIGKVLGQGFYDTDTAVYTTPSDTTAYIKSIVVHNPDSSPQSFTLSIKRGSDSAMVFLSQTLQPDETYYFNSTLILETDDALRFSSTLEGGLPIWVSGGEELLSTST